MDRLSTAENGAVPMSEFYVGTVPHNMYVQHWRRPLGSASKGSVVMIHGGFHTGTTWTTTPDGRAGWAHRFTELGWDVYVVDWAGTGRSIGMTLDSATVTAEDVVDGLAALLDRTGPVVLLGHSIGAAFALLVAERAPHAVRAIAALAPASVESPVDGWVPAPEDQGVVLPDDIVRALFANSDAFPSDFYDNYVGSLVPLSPTIFNASLGLTADLRTNPANAPGWGSRIPLLLLVADQDQLIPESRAEETSSVLGVSLTRLATEWGKPGHGHNFVIEAGSEDIADRVEAWLVDAVGNG